VKISLAIFRGNPQLGGAERYTGDLAAALARRGHRVTLVSSEFGEAIAGVEFIKIPLKSSTRTGRYGDYLDGLEAHLAKNQPDIVHAMLPVRQCNVYHPHAGLAKLAATADLASRLNRKRLRFARVERELLSGPRPPVVLCLSDEVKKLVRQTYPKLPLKLEKLFNAVDLEKFDPLKRREARGEIRRRFGISDSEVVALFISQNFLLKGLPQTIEAIAGMPEIQKPRLIVVGKEDPKPHQKLAEKLGVARHVIFAGTTTAADDFYRAADFFVLPTRRDQCSLVVLEALAMGLPVISTIFNGACEIMADGRDGFVLNSATNVAALAEAMEQLTDPETRAAMHAACRQLRPELSYETHLNRLEWIYESALAR